jgi:hypothetical protein
MHGLILRALSALRILSLSYPLSPMAVFVPGGKAGMSGAAVL